ncbi:MAG: methionine synthase [Bacteroidales bacterium]|nr:methionine synthase [Bacteroidales bacterium]
MTEATFQYRLSDLNLDITQIERFMGYKDGESHGTVTELISSILEEAEEICDIRAEYHIRPVAGFNDADKSLTLDHDIFNIGRIIYGQIKRSESVALFLCTAGREIGSKSRKEMRGGDLLKGYLYDVVGSEIVEAAADLMQNSLELSMAVENRRITNRYSPGYCGWDVAEQHKLFRPVPYNFCGIRLTPSALMDPVKSVSGIIGIGEKVKRLPYTCNLCDMKDCIYRRGRGQ